MEFLIVIEPASGGRYEHRVAPGSYVLGREEAFCDIAILSPEVSRQHARIHLSAEQCTVEDLGSTAGTSKDGQALEGKQSFPFPVAVMLGTTRLSIATSEALEMTFDSAAQGAATMKPATGIVFDQGAPTASVPQAEAGHYTKGREIARGGMGAILEANDRLLGRTVAMKVVLEDRTSEDARMRFIREATVLGQLEHPNIIPIHELGKDDHGNLFYTMKMVEGRTLQAIINELKNGDADTIKDYSLDGLLTVFRKVCDAIAFAHSKGIVHRDLKPENIMVGAFGEVLVMDWGLAKILNDAAQTADELGQRQLLSNTNADGTESSLPSGFHELSDSQMRGSSEDLTMDGAVMGSPQYMPPEQAEGRITEIDERSDVYSLGGILYAILTLHPPIQGKTVVQVLLNVKSGNITPPSLHNPASPAQAKKKPIDAVRADLTLPHCPGHRVPGALSSVCMKALSMEPDDRYATTRSLAADIEAFQTGRATSAEEITFFGQFLLLLKRNPQVSATIGLAALTITALITASLVLLNNAKLEAEGERDLATRATEELEKKEEKTREALARSQISLAEAALVNANRRLVSSSLAKVPEAFRNQDWEFVHNQINTRFVTVTGRLAQVVAARPHPRRPSIFAVMDAKGALSLVNATTGEHVFEYPHLLDKPAREKTWPTRRSLAFTADGRRLAVAHAGKITFLDGDTGDIQGEWRGRPDLGFNWSQDGRMLSTQWGVLDVTTGRELWVSATPKERQTFGFKNRNVFFLNNPKQLLELCHARNQFRNPRDGKVIRRLQAGASGPLEEVAMSPTKQEILIRRYSSEIVEYQQVGSGTVRLITPEMKLTGLAFLHDGLRLLVAGAPNEQDFHLKTFHRGTGQLLDTKFLDDVGPIRAHSLTGEIIILGKTAAARAISFRNRKPWMTFEKGAGDILWEFAFVGSDEWFIGPPTFKRDLKELKPAPEPNEPDVRRFFWNMDVDKNSFRARPSPSGRLQGNYYRALYPDKSGLRFAAFSWNDTVGIFEREKGGTNFVFRSDGKLKEKPIPRRLSFDPEVKRFWSNYGIWDAESRDLLLRLKVPEGHQIEHTVWLPDGKGLIGLTREKEPAREASNWQAVRWNAETGEIRIARVLPCAMNAIKLAPDSSRLALAGVDKSVHFLKTDTLEPMDRLRAHNGEVTHLSWHPAHPILATTSTDLATKLWNLENGHEIETIWAIRGKPQGLKFSPSGKLLLLHSHFGKIYVYDVRDLFSDAQPVTLNTPNDRQSEGSILPPLHSSLTKSIK